jgi:tetratricopeptide (TPR) repeat protein
LWLLGRADEAVRAAQFSIEATDELSHPVSTFVVLIYATTVFIWCNRWLDAENAIRRLQAHSQAQMLVYRVIASALEAVLRCRRGATRADLEALRNSLERLVAEGHLILVPLCRTVLADALLSAGLLNEANAVIDAAVVELGPQVDGPEVLRVKGAIMIARGQIDEGEDFLRRSIELAREQSALAWELRAAICLAQVPGLARKDAVLSDLASVTRRFREGGETDDLRAANQLLESRGS